MRTFDAKAQAALSFLFSELTFVEQEVLRQPYPEIKYPSIIPVDTSAEDFAEAIAFKTLDFTGEPKLLGDKSNDIPLVEVASAKGSVTVHEYALGYDWTLTEVGKAQAMARNSRTAAINYLAEKANGVRQLIEQFLDKGFFIGDGRTKDIKTGLLNDEMVPVTDTGTLLGGANQTIDQILNSGDSTEVKAQKLLDLFQNGILQVWEDQTNTIFRPTHILLPVRQYGRMSTFRIPNTSETLISYLERVLKIKFEPLLHLKGRGSGGVDRMMIYTRDSKYVKAHMPMPFNLQPPGTKNNIVFESAGLLRTAGTELRVPKMHTYVDGV